ncbi:MAG: GTPase [Deltaproteobacteria bacterium]|nr:GTPase [Candidatus Anaeroferrophillacea bacterium]
MAIFNYQKREIGAKIVYYGPALCGKTTNVQFIHLKLNPRQRGELVSLATDSDRTLFFDFLPIELENIGGFKTRFHIYTVPGQVYYNSTRKAVLTGVDGVIFVADSQRSMLRENLESLENLRENLRYYNRDLDTLPLIIQYNKRDMDDVMPVDELNEHLNPRSLPFYEGVAVKGTGVLPTLTSCCKLVLQQLKKKSAAARGGTATSAAPSRPAATPPEPAAQPIDPFATAADDGSGFALESPSPAAPIKSTPTPPRIPLAGDDTGTARLESGPAPWAEFKPEVVRVGKVVISDPHRITIPMQLALDERHDRLLSVDLSLTINHLIRKDD